MVPVYEIKSVVGRDVMPSSKAELLAMVERYYARRYR